MEKAAIPPGRTARRPPGQLALLGAAAFGLGLALHGLLAVNYGTGLLTFALAGAIGAGALGLGRPGAWGFTVAGAAGALLGFGIGLFITIAVWDPPVLGAGIPGLAGGALTGAALGWARRSGRQAVVLAVAGGLGFCIGFLLWGFLRNASQPLGQAAVGAIGGAIMGIPGGAALGLALSRVEEV